MTRARPPSSRLGKFALASGLGLAAGAAFAHYQARRAERENPPAGRFVEVDGVRLHYLERGQGQPVVLLHGNVLSLDDFDLSGLIDRLATRYRVIAFDRPGYGHSQRPGEGWTPEAQASLLHKSLLRLAVERPLILGHSWGALVAAALALEAPDYVDGLVLLSGYYYPTTRLDVPLPAAQALPVIGPLLRHTLSPVAGRLGWKALSKAMFSPSQPPASFQRYPQWMSLRPSQLQASGEEAALMVPAADRLQERYGELRLPVAILAGEQDRVADARHHSGRLHQQIPGSRLAIIPGAGHMVHYDAPEQVVAAIDQLARPDASAAAI